MKTCFASDEFGAATHDSAEEPFADARTFMRETGELQRITVRCLVVALRRLLPAEGFFVGAVWSEGHRVIRFRAVLPYRLVRRSQFHQRMEFKMLFERINNCASTSRIELRQFGPYLDFSAEVEPST
jgi:hypothetical protein